MIKSSKEVIQYDINHTSSIQTAKNRLPYFTRCGHKASVESRMRKILITYSSQNTIKNYNKDSSNLNLFKSFEQSAIPYIGIKTRRKRRGKRIINKLTLSTRFQSQRKAFRGLSKSVRIPGRATKSFIFRLGTELKTLSQIKHKRVSSNTSLRENRDNLHRSALKAIPFS